MSLPGRKRVAALGLLGSLAVAGAAYAATADTSLKGSVGPGATIRLVDGSGATVTRLDPGPVELEVEDIADTHNFHLTGPGNVNVSTGVDTIETKKFALTLVDGTYSFICDAHPLTMKGAFAVGAATTPPPPSPPPSPSPPPPPPSGPAPSAPIGSRLVLTGGPGGALSLKTVAGKPVKRLRPGAYRVTARDRSATRGLRLRGAGAARATTAAFVGTKAWKVTLREGTLTYLLEPSSGSARRTVTVG